MFFKLNSPDCVWLWLGGGGAEPTGEARRNHLAYSGGGGWQRRRPEPDASTAKINLLFINLLQIALVGFTLIEFEKLCASLEVPA